MIPNPCLDDFPEILKLRPAKRAPGILCYEHCRDDVDYRTGIKYGTQRLMVVSGKDRLQIGDIHLVRVEADGLKDNNPDSKDLDTADAPFARTRFPDFTA